MSFSPPVRVTRIAVVGGGGHVGLPLSLVLAEHGFTVTVIDRDAVKIEALKEGRFPFVERGGAELLERAHKEEWKLTYTTDAGPAVSNAEVIVLTIGTPVDEHLNANVTDIFSCVDALVPHLRTDGNQTIVLRSTIFPGTTERVAQRLADRGFGSVGLCFCPERIAQGFAVEELRRLPQIVSGSSRRAVEVAAKLFEPLGVELLEMDLVEAEVAKLFLNAWRYIHFATANQFYVLAQEKGLDFKRIRGAMTYKYDRAKHMPTAGLTAGPCLFKDTMVLASYARSSSSLCHAAMLINETMPEVLVTQGKELAGSLRGKKVGLLGLAFKGDNDDTRDSLAFKLRRLLLYEGAEVLCADPFIPVDSAKGKQLVPHADAAACELVFVGCPHSEYKQLQLRPEQKLVDCWGICSLPRLPVRKKEIKVATPFDIKKGPPKKILVTGCHGFIMGYVIPILLENGHEVWGVDNYWKYGKLSHGYDNHPKFHFTEGDAKDKALLSKLLEENQINIFVAAAAIIGGIAMFHKLAYFLLSENEKITCAAFDACVEAYNGGKGALEKVMVISSSMVFESCDVFPSAESDLPRCPPPQSTYGFQKLACEYFAKGAFEQHGLPYVIVRPFNAVGVGERRAVVSDGCEVLSGNVKLTMSHVVPDLVQKILHGQKPLHILGSGQQRRHYTYAGDLAMGMVRCMLDPRAVGRDYNISTPQGHTVIELAQIIWKRLRPGEEFSVTSDNPFEYDVQCRVPDVEKSTRELGIECTTSLETALDEIVPWIKEQMELGTI